MPTQNIDGVEVELTGDDLADYQARLAATPPRRLITKSVVQERAHALGKLAPILAILRGEGQEINYARWFAPDWPRVYFDDAGMLALLSAVGCNAEEIAAITAP